MFTVARLTSFNKLGKIITCTKWRGKPPYIAESWTSAHIISIIISEFHKRKSQGWQLCVVLIKTQHKDPNL